MQTPRWRDGGEGRPAAQPLAQGDGLMWLFIVGVLVRLFAGAAFLDRFIGYSATGGSPVEKIAPGAYILGLAALLAARRRPSPDMAGVVPAAILLATVAVCGVGWSVATGGFASIGAMIDSYLAAAAGVFTVSRLSARQRETAFQVMLCGLGANYVALTGEFVTQRRLLSDLYVTTDGVFRPMAALDHPLMSGLVYASAAPLLLRLRGPLSIRVFLTGLAVSAVLMSGARFASIVTVVVVPVAILLAVRAEPRRPGPQQWASWLQLVVVATAAPIAAVLGLTGGLAYRFKSSIVDQSSLKRLNDFILLSYAPPHTLWFGGGSGALQRWSEQLLHGSSIESPIVLGIFVFGLPFAAFLFLSVIVAFYLLSRSRNVEIKLAFLTFLVVAGSNNVLLVKSGVMTFSLCLAMAAPFAATPRRVAQTSRMRQPTWRARPPAIPRRPRPGSWRSVGENAPPR